MRAGIIAAFTAYICWLSWPSLLPLGTGPDIVHHLSLIHYIQQHGSLPHDPRLGAYLGEMNSYPPGSHLLAAGAAGVLGVDAVRVVHPLIALFVGFKAGLVYAILLRLLGRSEVRTPVAVAGTLLMLVPHAYLLQSITRYGFYSQVIAETFAVAMVWATVAWNDSPTYQRALLVSICGIAVVLCWPVSVPAPAVGFLVLALARRSMPIAARIRQAVVALGPIAVVAMVFAATHRSSAGILSSGGSVLTPAIGLFGWPFLALTGIGALLAVRRHGAWLAVLAFGAACLAQIAALFALQAYLGASNFYLPFKTVHLLVYAMILLASLPLGPLAEALPRRLAWALPALVLAWGWRAGVPRWPAASPLTEPVYQAGVWARDHVAAQCVDYFVDDWLTGYWLHIDVLGNPRASERMRVERFEERTAIGRWIEGQSLPFAIAGDLESLPRDLLPSLRVLRRFGPAAVVQRADGVSTCTDRTPTIHELQD